MRTLIWYFKEILAFGYHWEKQASQLSQKCLGYETDLSAEILGTPKLEASMAVLRACLTSPLQVSAWNMLSARANESVVLGTIVDRKVPFHREIFLLMHPPSRIATDWSSHMTLYMPESCTYQQSELLAGTRHDSVAHQNAAALGSGEPCS